MEKKKVDRDKCLHEKVYREYFGGMQGDLICYACGAPFLDHDEVREAQEEAKARLKKLES